ncbi:Ku protein [Georgenia sunbinii]|uniref:non-homologous end joining protein Ku n=1 Tax=Georgenia sunbinii TaxID=3117728 RepID=UPI002F268886
MRAIWKGSISFGLVNVPVSLYSATQSHDISLHQVHDADGGRIRYQRRCEVCGEVVEWAQIAKAYDDGERTVVLTDEELAELPTERSREIEIQQFVPSEQIDPMVMGKSYYLGPASSSTKSYALLRRTLEETSRTAVVSFTLRQRSQLGALRVRDKVLVLQALLWQDELREPDFDLGSSRVSAKELEMSSTLVDSYSGDFDPSEYTDDYQEQLQILVEAKLKEGETVDTAATFGEEKAADEGEDAEVVDLMEALRRSVSAAKGKKSGSGSGSKSGTGSKSGASSTTSETKSTAKKPAATKSTTKKPASAKSGSTGKKATKQPKSA